MRYAGPMSTALPKFLAIASLVAGVLLCFQFIRSRTESPGASATSSTLKDGNALDASALAPKINQADSANEDGVVKSWTVESLSDHDKRFLDSLSWQDHPVSDEYVLRSGKIYDRWVAATQLMRNGKLVLTEITPGQEYITVVDPRTGRPAEKPLAVDANNDQILEMAFLHEKLNDPKYHMYTVYALTERGPELIWKSGGELGDWLRGNHKAAPVQWDGRATQ